MKPKTQEEQAKYSLGKETDGKKQSNSKRLRNVLYLLHQQDCPTLNFDDYYNSEMEVIIDSYKSKLKSGVKTEEDKQSEVTQTA